MSERIEPFAIAVPEAELDELRRRLARTRWPDAVVGDWSDGTDLAYLREIADYWREGFDWRRAEARLNAIPQVRVDCGGLRVHALHLRGTGPSPLPLIVTHGWPGSVVEMLDILPRLADPGAFGGDPADAFHLVVPSLPGYGFSDRPRAPGTNVQAIARLWLELMSALGYERFGAQGGDWGAGVSTQLGIFAPERLVGVHLNYVLRAYLPKRREPLDYDGEERAYFEDSDAFFREEGAYSHQHATRPQSLAYGLNDSPAGLAAWILEKFRRWSDCDGRLENAFRRDDLLANVSLYWFTQTIASSIRLYRERELRPATPPPHAPGVPYGIAAFPKELPMPPRRLVERAFRVTRYERLPRGGHFAAMEQPELLANEIRAFFRPLR
ncbi:MAG: epoxide hydrolase family protein [Vulcanimicrobiaceae bacterium]